MNLVRSNSLSLKYLRFAQLGGKDIRIGKFEFVAKTQFPLKMSPSEDFNLERKSQEFYKLRGFFKFNI